MTIPQRLSAAVLVAAAASAALAGCSSPGSATGASAPASATPKSALVPVFPTTLSAANGSVTIKSEPKRIVSLDPTATEDLYAIGAGSQVVAVDQDSDYPTGVPVTSLSGLTPNIEAIAKYNPSLVVASQDSGGLVSGLGKLGIPVLIEPAVATLVGAYNRPAPPTPVAVWSFDGTHLRRGDEVLREASSESSGVGDVTTYR